MGRSCSNQKDIALYGHKMMDYKQELVFQLPTLKIHLVYCFDNEAENLSLIKQVKKEIFKKFLKDKDKFFASFCVRYVLLGQSECWESMNICCWE